MHFSTKGIKIIDFLNLFNFYLLYKKVKNDKDELDLIVH